MEDDGPIRAAPERARHCHRRASLSIGRHPPGHAVRKSPSLAGVVVVRDGSFVAAAAPNTHIAKKTIQAIEETAKWDSSPHPSSKDLPAYLRRHAHDIPANPFKDEGKPIRATYTAAYIQHA